MIPTMKVVVLLMEEVQLGEVMMVSRERCRRPWRIQPIASGYRVVGGCKSARDSAFEMNAHILYNQSASDSPLDKNNPSL